LIKSKHPIANSLLYYLGYSSILTASFAGEESALRDP